MDKKGLIRRKYSLKRKKNYFEIRKSFFNPLVKLIKTKKIKKISLYFPNSYEVNLLKIFELKYFKKFLLIFHLLFYLIHHFYSLPEVYHYHQCNDRL